jgi:4-amino-4-deoxy-L-arabinose transferase-like glycosyltransferase
MVRRTFIQRHGPLIAVLIVSAFLALIRVRIADVPIERDEGEYAYAAQLILQGIPPYKLAYNMKFPGTYYAYSVILGLFGQTPMGIHIGLLIVNAATILIIFFLARRIFKDGVAAAVAASAFGFLTIDRWIMGLFAHATHFVVFSGTAGLLVLLRAIDSRKTPTFIFSGVMLGLSVLMKQNGIFFSGQPWHLPLGSK